jgi:hypothetical protein
VCRSTVAVSTTTAHTFIYQLKYLDGSVQLRLKSEAERFSVIHAKNARLSGCLDEFHLDFVEREAVVFR